MNARQKRIKRVTDLNLYRERRVVYDMPPQRALVLSSDVRRAYDVDQMIEQIGTMIDEKR